MKHVNSIDCIHLNNEGMSILEENFLRYIKNDFNSEYEVVDELWCEVEGKAENFESTKSENLDATPILSDNVNFTPPIDTGFVSESEGNIEGDLDKLIALRNITQTTVLTI